MMRRDWGAWGGPSKIVKQRPMSSVTFPGVPIWADALTGGCAKRMNSMMNLVDDQNRRACSQAKSGFRREIGLRAAEPENGNVFINPADLAFGRLQSNHEIGRYQCSAVASAEAGSTRFPVIR